LINGKKSIGMIYMVANCGGSTSPPRAVVLRKNKKIPLNTKWETRLLQMILCHYFKTDSLEIYSLFDFNIAT
jgi:hypothetical protein